MAAANLALGSKHETHWTYSLKMDEALDYTLVLRNTQHTLRPNYRNIMVWYCQQATEEKRTSHRKLSPASSYRENLTL